MPSLPQDPFQLGLLLLLVLPGTVYQFARTRLRGPSPDDTGALSRVLRALGVSALLVAVYALAAGPQVLRLAAQAQSNDAGTALAAVRPLAAWALLLLVVTPAALAALDHARRLGTLRPQSLLRAYDPTPRAWDDAFTNRDPCYVRVLTADGRYLGGWYGQESFASSYPEPREIFLESAHYISADGEFGDEVPHSAGLYIRCTDVQSVELVAPPGGEAHHEEPTRQESPDATSTD